jgi:hypothetical protein
MLPPLWLDTSLSFPLLPCSIAGYCFFFRSPRTTRLLWISCAVGLVVLAYFSAVEDRVTVSRFGLPITLSIGLTFAAPCETALSMLARADMALYNAKRAGRNCTRVLLASIDEDGSDRICRDDIAIVH